MAIRWSVSQSWGQYAFDRPAALEIVLAENPGGPEYRLRGLDDWWQDLGWVEDSASAELLIEALDAVSEAGSGSRYGPDWPYDAPVEGDLRGVGWMVEGVVGLEGELTTLRLRLTRPTDGTEAHLGVRFGDGPWYGVADLASWDDANTTLRLIDDLAWAPPDRVAREER